jgi:hypothetical protein
LTIEVFSVFLFNRRASGAEWYPLTIDLVFDWLSCCDGGEESFEVDSVVGLW